MSQEIAVFSFICKNYGNPFFRNVFFFDSPEISRKLIFTARKAGPMSVRYFSLTRFFPYKDTIQGLSLYWKNRVRENRHTGISYKVLLLETLQGFKFESPR